MKRRKILMIDVGGTNVKLMVSGKNEVRKVPSGPAFTAKQMANEVLAATKDWNYDAITIGYPSLIEDGKPVREPLNLGGGWLAFNYEKVFKKPVRFINDASMQALANYNGGRMLFIGFGTSTGAAYIIHDVIVPLEIGLLRLTKRGQFMGRLCKEHLKRIGKKRWMRYVQDSVSILQDVFKPTDTVLGGGNAKLIDPLPPGSRLSANNGAFRGAERIWPGSDMLAEPLGNSWRIKHKRRRA
jgi:polyphosphate glucokinase